MRDKHDRLFDRFRQRGDVRALGEVFDATAAELLRVASSLVRDANEADDLLQQTFLTAIERRERYDGARRLLPWLLGILVQHAREERRRRARTLEPARLARPEPARPETLALESEVDRELERALGGPSRDHRVVLDDYLRADKTPAEIARERGLSPGAARMRIHRGLDRLRKALPAGIVLGSAGAASAQGLGAVRAAVIRAGTTAAKEIALGAGSAAGAGTAGLLGGLMGKKLILAGGAVALTAGRWFVAEGGTRSKSEARGGEIARGGMTDRVPAAPAVELVAAPRAESAITVSPSGEPARTALAVVVDPELSGLRGRVVEHDGSPLPGVQVTLIEIDELQLFPALFADGAELPRILAASAVTGRDGVFELRGATTRAQHALGVDLGGQRATVRIVEAELSPGSIADLGDVVLAPAGVLSGTVVDPAGRPVAGARVRVGAIPELGRMLGLQHLAAGGAITELDGKRREPRFVVEFPAWVSALEERLPLATTTTDAGGRFTLTAAAGSLTALVDAPGFARFTSATLGLAGEERQDIGQLVLSVGKSVHGRVLDASGRAVAGAELRAGSVSERESLAVFGPIRTSDADGRFAFEHLPDDLATAVIGRRDALSPWTSPREENGELVLRLESGKELVVEVLDAAGAPVPAPAFLVGPGRDVDQPAAFAPPPCAVPATPLGSQPGCWKLGPLAPGTYLVEAGADGFARSSARAEAGDGEPATVRLRLARSRRTEILVRDAAGEAIAGARVSAEERPTVPLAYARTGGDGRAALELPDDPSRKLHLCVSHPRFAPSVRVLEAAPSITVELTAGARLVARLADPVLARESCTLQLWPTGSEGYLETHLPLIRAVPRDGALELDRLAPGNWEWSLFGSVGSCDVLALLTPEHMPRVLAHGEIVLAEGQTFELAITGAPPAHPASAGVAISGVVRVEGRLAGELQVNLCPMAGADGEAATLYTEGTGGRFRLDDVPPGHYILSVETPVPGDPGKK